MEVRKIMPADDVAAIADIYVQSWKTAYRGIVPQDFLDKLDGNGWADFLREGQCESYVVIKGNRRYMGTASVCPAREKSMTGWGELVSLYLLPEAFGKGYAEPLFCAAMRGLLQMGYEEAYLWVLEENLRAQRFYEKQGFRKNGDRMEIAVGGKELVEIRYVKRIV